jgi:hypothetical protein
MANADLQSAKAFRVEYPGGRLILKTNDFTEALEAYSINNEDGENRNMFRWVGPNCMCPPTYQIMSPKVIVS